MAARETLAAPAQPVAFIGLGAMGGPMVGHLRRRGLDVLVYDLDAAAVRSAQALGARAVASPAEAASQAEMVLVCLPSLKALRDVLFGDAGLVQGEALRTVVDFSTTGSRFARESAAALGAHGIGLLTAPITGSVTTAGNGQLGVMCSGPRAAFQHAEPVLQLLAGAGLLYLGEEAGKAQTLKLLNNLLSATGMAVSCEAFILGMKAGLDPRTMLDIVNAGDASSSATRNKFARSVLTRRFDYGARMAITAKDISLAVEEAEELGVPMWVGQAVRQVWRYAVSQGGADRDGTALITFLEPWAGVEVREQGRAVAAAGHAVERTATREFVVIADVPAVPALAERLRRKGWDVSGAGEPPWGRDVALADPNNLLPCRLVGVTPGSGAADALAALATVDTTSATVVNTCPMPAAQAQALSQALAARGTNCLDAAISHHHQEGGERVPAVLVSGSRAAVDHATPLLEAIADRHFFVSKAPGAAQLMLHIEGSLFATLLAVSCEAFTAGAKAGLDPLTMTRILGIETGRNAASARIVPEQVATRRFQDGRHIVQALRDLTSLQEEGRRLGVTTWILDRASALYGLAAGLGSPADDITRLITHYEAWARTTVVAGLGRGAP